MAITWAGYKSLWTSLKLSTSNVFLSVSRSAREVRPTSRRTATGTLQPPQPTGRASSAGVRMRFPPSETPLEIGCHFRRSFWRCQPPIYMHERRLDDVAKSNRTIVPRKTSGKRDVLSSPRRGTSKGSRENPKSSRKKINSTSYLAREKSLHYTVTLFMLYCYITINSLIRQAYIRGKDRVFFLRGTVL